MPATPRRNLSREREITSGNEPVASLLQTLRSALPAELAEHLRAGDAPAERSVLPRFPTRIDAVDALLEGGFPRGRVSEVTGPPSSGRTSLVLALLAAATRAGETTAIVDAANAFDPASACAAGVDLGRVLWARPPRPREALRCTERLLDARGFGVVVLDLDRGAARTDADADEPSFWMRLSRSAQASGTALVLLAPRTQVGPFAALTLEAHAARPRFEEQPAWLSGLESHIAPLRSRIGALRGTARVEWRTQWG